MIRAKVFLKKAPGESVQLKIKSLCYSQKKNLKKMNINPGGVLSH